MDRFVLNLFTAVSKLNCDAFSRRLAGSRLDVAGRMIRSGPHKLPLLNGPDLSCSTGFTYNFSLLSRVSIHSMQSEILFYHSVRPSVRPSIQCRSFLDAVNRVFDKLLNLDSEVVILELVKSKCLPILLYGLECCNLRSAYLHSLDITYNRLFMKLFKTKKTLT